MKLLKVGLVLGLLYSSGYAQETNKMSVDAKAISSILGDVASKTDPVIEMPSNGEIQKMGDYYGAKALGTLAYQWGYALLRMESAMRDYIDVPNPKPDTSYRAPLNQIGWAKKLPMASDKDMPTANNDTFYMSAVVDLTEPYILETPDTQDRYYVVNVFDMYQNLTNYIGRRTTGTKANIFAIVPPEWKGELPKNVTNVIHAQTQKIWLWGRLNVLEGEELAPVHKLQKEFKLRTLSEYGGKKSTTASTTLPQMPDITKDDKLGFYKKLAFVMNQNPIFAQDKALVGQFEKIGLTPGKFDDSKLNEEQKQGLYDATLEAPLTIIASLQSSSEIVNGWTWVTKLDNFGYDYALRSMIAGPYLGGQGEKEALYPIRYTDDDNKALDGHNSYKVHFEKEPPVNAFWSLTMYDAQNKLFVDNELDRYKISTESKGLVKNKDGSYDILIQNKKPESTDNWLPSPNGPFYIILRLYQPNDDILSQKYKLPTVSKFN
ncbi:DUF1254 domain-containing protein [Sulfurovum sp.]|uniref:DUF1254 domain-containing protein n=1 Tax=Sulfurovum sp. TaxID=1969726 RepID=UPI00286833F0|nr:DUF1254 domain-containing protein [Sulfurovum sp.]